MPHFTNQIAEPGGPIINVRIAPSAPRRNALTDAGKQVPSPENARLLIDTGASMTSIDHALLEKLGLQPTGSIKMHTPSTDNEPISVSTFDVELNFRGIKGSAHTFPSLGVIGCNFSDQGIDGLFGRDALEKSRLIYSGPDNNWMLSF